MAEEMTLADLPPTIEAAETWLTRLQQAFVDWRTRQNSGEAAEDLWQNVIRWYSAFELSFSQLAEHLEDLVDVADARLANEDISEAVLVDGIRMRPMARQRLRALAGELGDHLAQTHLVRLFPLPQDVERVSGLEDLFRIRAHGCRVIYRVDRDGPLILAVTAGQWRSRTPDLPS